MLLTCFPWSVCIHMLFVFFYVCVSYIYWIPCIWHELSCYTRFPLVTDQRNIFFLLLTYFPPFFCDLIYVPTTSDLCFTYCFLLFFNWTRFTKICWQLSFNLFSIHPSSAVSLLLSSIPPNDCRNMYLRYVFYISRFSNNFPPAIFSMTCSRP